MNRFRRISFTLFVALLVAGCGQKPDPKQAAQEFFNQVANGQAEQAYGETAFAFQAQQQARVFEQAAREQGLIGSKGVTLAPQEVDGKTAKFDATVSTADGGQRNFIVTLQFESGKWRIFSIKAPRNLETGLREGGFSLMGKGSALTEALTQPMPEEKEVRRLITETLKKFNDAILQKSFADFYANVSQTWQSQLTERQLERAFQPFVDQGVDISRALELEAVLDGPPQITTEGLLVTSGHYASTPYQVQFALKFIYELPQWKLFGIDVNLRKAPEQQ